MWPLIWSTIIVSCLAASMQCMYRACCFAFEDIGYTTDQESPDGRSTNDTTQSYMQYSWSKLLKCPNLTAQQNFEG